MSTNELHLDKLIYARAKRLAEKKNVSVEELVSEAIEAIERFTIGDTANNQMAEKSDKLLEAKNLSLEQILAPVLNAADQIVANSTLLPKNSASETWSDGLIEKFRAQGFKF